MRILFCLFFAFAFSAAAFSQNVRSGMFVESVSGVSPDWTIVCQSVDLSGSFDAGAISANDTVFAVVSGALQKFVVQSASGTNPSISLSITGANKMPRNAYVYLISQGARFSHSENMPPEFSEMLWSYFSRQDYPAKSLEGVDISGSSAVGQELVFNGTKYVPTTTSSFAVVPADMTTTNATATPVAGDLLLSVAMVAGETWEFIFDLSYTSVGTTVYSEGFRLLWEVPGGTTLSGTMIGPTGNTDAAIIRILSGGFNMPTSTGGNGPSTPSKFYERATLSATSAGTVNVYIGSETGAVATSATLKAGGTITKRKI